MPHSAPGAATDYTHPALDPARWRLLFAAILVLGFALRALYLLHFSASPLFDAPVGPDVTEYLRRAKEILSGRILWTKVQFHGPGYAWFLAALYRLCGGNLLAVRALQLLAGLGSMTLMTLTLRRLAGPRPALLCALFWVLYAPLIYYEAELVSEGLVLLLLSAALYTLARYQSARHWRLPLLAGLFCGGAAITHPTSLLPAAALFAWMLLRSIREDRSLPATAKLLLMPLAIALVVLPVTARNYAVSGELVLIQKRDGLNFFIGNNPEADGTCYVRPGAPWLMLNALPGPGRTLSERNAFFYGKSLEFIKEQPGDYLRLLLRKLLYAVNHRELTAGADSEELYFATPFMRWPLPGFGVLGVLLIVALGVVRGPPALLLPIIAGYWGGMTIFVVSGRYRVGMLGAAIALAACAVDQIVVRRRERKVQLAVLAGLLAGAAMVFLPDPPALPSARLEKLELYAEAYLHQRRFEDAARSAEERIALADGFGARLMQGQALLQLGRIGEARDAFERACELNPRSLRARVYLASCLRREGALGQALGEIERCERTSPRSPEVLFEAGMIHARLGDPERARSYYDATLARQPGHSGALTRRGKLRLDAGDTRAALGDLERACELDPRSFMAAYHAALCCERLGAADQARAHAEQASRLDRTGDPGLRALLRRLDAAK